MKREADGAVGEVGVLNPGFSEERIAKKYQKLQN